MNQPTLATVPGILFRTFMRVVARILFTIAGAVLIVGAALALCSLLLATWRTPRGRRTELIVDLVLILTELAKDRNRVTKTD